jgi:hypothetical protein
MAHSSTSWRKGCGTGCAITLGLGIVILIGIYAVIKGSGERTIATRKALAQTYASPAEFTPALDGSIPTEHIRRFLDVRWQLIPYCEDLTRDTVDIQRMGRYEESEDEPPLKPFVTDVGHALRGVFGLARRLNTYLITRNRALMAAEMGLGEYTWIYVLAYYSWLGHRPEKFVIDETEYPRVFNDRVRGQIKEMIRRHVGDLEAGLAEAGSRRNSSRSDAKRERRSEESLSRWRAELAALETDPARMPFAGGLPQEIASSLEPFRPELEELYCPATCEIDLTQTEREGIGFEHF